jgi:hypothetical protein
MERKQGPRYIFVVDQGLSKRLIKRMEANDLSPRVLHEGCHVVEVRCGEVFVYDS